MTRRTNDQILDDLAGEFIPDWVDLTPRVIAKIPRRSLLIPRSRVSASTVSALVLILLGLAIIVLFAGLPQVASAMRQWIGFLPGVGLVDRSAPVRVLQAPVSLARDGVTVTIEQVTALPERTVIQFKVNGIPGSAYPQNTSGKSAPGFLNECLDPLFLRLPDGTPLTYSGYNAITNLIGEQEKEVAFTVQPVPGDIDDVTLVMPCIQGTERQALPGAWEFSLHLIPAAELAQALPVYELTLPAPTSTSQGLIVNLPASTSGQNSSSAIRLVLDKVVPLPDGDQLYGSLQWDEHAPYSAVSLDAFQITGAQGEQIPALQISPDPSLIPTPGSHLVPFAFKVAGQQPGLLALTVERLSATLPVKDTNFVFDTGTAPHTGQEWVLNQDIQVENSAFRVVSVKRLVDGYEFSIQPTGEIACVDLYLEGAKHVRGSCGRGITKMQYDGEIPAGFLTVVVANLEVSLTGTWQATWLPPESEQNKDTKP